MVFVYVSLEVADFSVMFAYWDPIESITYGVYNVYAGWSGLVSCRWLLCLLVGMRFRCLVRNLTFCIIMFSP
jgi:hypothetical protein